MSSVNDNDPILLLTAKDLSRVLKLSVRSIWRLRSAEKFPAPIKVGRSARWDQRDIAQFLEGLKGEDRHVA